MTRSSFFATWVIATRWGLPSARFVLCQCLELNEGAHSEFSARKLANGFIRASVHVGDFLRRGVIRQDIQCGNREPVLKKRLELREDLVKNISQFN